MANTHAWWKISVNVDFLQSSVDFSQNKNTKRLFRLSSGKNYITTILFSSANLLAHFDKLIGIS